jgi:transcriptional regulator GlxA family with amidase domain
MTDIEFLLHDGFDDLDVFGPFEVLRAAGFTTRLVTVHPTGQIVTAHGIRVVPDGTLGDPDLVLVPGGNWRPTADKGETGAAMVARHEAGRRIGSVCTGANILARAGLLQGRPAITHHSGLEELAADGAIVQHGERYVDDGDIVTAAGVTSGIDLALHLVELEYGAEAAAKGAERIEWPS